MKYKLIHIITASDGEPFIMPWYDIFYMDEWNRLFVSAGILLNIRDAFSYSEKRDYYLASEEDILSLKMNNNNIVAEADSIEELKMKVVEYLV